MKMLWKLTREAAVPVRGADSATRLNPVREAAGKKKRRAEECLHQLAEHWAYFLGEMPTALVNAFKKLL